MGPYRVVQRAPAGQLAGTADTGVRATDDVAVLAAEPSPAMRP